jgi:hypothetical protein
MREQYNRSIEEEKVVNRARDSQDGLPQPIDGRAGQSDQPMVNQRIG